MARKIERRKAKDQEHGTKDQRLRRPRYLHYMGLLDYVNQHVTERFHYLPFTTIKGGVSLIIRLVPLYKRINGEHYRE